jgi:hypothetical protein
MPTMSALAVAVSLALAGCASTSKDGWRIEPAFRIQHAGPTGAGEGYLALGRQYDGERRWDLALQSYRKAALEAPWDVDILNALGLAEAGQGHHARAVAVLRRAVVLAPDRAQIINNLGYALMLEGRVDEARDFLRLALKVEPGHARARQNLDQLEASVAAAQPAAPAPSRSAPEPSPPLVAAAEPEVPRLRVLSAPNLPPLQLSTAPLEPASSTPTPVVLLTIASVELPPLAVVAEPSVPEMVPQRAESEPPAQIAPSAQPAAPTLPKPRVEISNGNGVRGMAAWLAGWLRERGLEGRSRLTNLRPYTSATTVVQYRPGFDVQAREIARRMPASVELVADPRRGAPSDVRIVLGHDLRDVATRAATTSVAAADTNR